MNDSKFVLSKIGEILAPLGIRLPTAASGDWLWDHAESGQSLDAYQAIKPLRRSSNQQVIYLTLIGEFFPCQERIASVTADYLSIFFDSPLRNYKRLTITDLHPDAQRMHPHSSHRQLRTTDILMEVLIRDRPEDALAMLAITADDLWPGEEWNFVFGEAYPGVAAVWSIHRFGNPAEGDEAYRLCLQRSLSTATHEMAHVLGMDHCIEFECNMNGCNHLDEADRKPLHFCPPCLRKLCWNLQVAPETYLSRLQAFMQEHDLREEAAWYHKAILTLGAGKSLQSR